jgi:NADPH2:quinone reductase
MRSVVVRRFGGPEVLDVSEVDDAVVGNGQVLVRLTVSGVNYLDVYQRIGSSPLKPPFLAGVEGVGTVVALGESVTDLAVGQRVGWMTGGQGSFSDLAAVSADKVVPIPDSVDDVTAAALLMQGITAHYLATDTAPIQAGDTVLIHAAAGGVGQLLTQIVKQAGGVVIGTASPQKADVARGAGVDHVLDYEGFADAVRDLTDGAGVAAVFDGVGASTFDGSLSAVRPRGTVALFGAASGPVPPVDPMKLAAAGSVFLTLPTVIHYTATVSELRSRAADLFAWIVAGQLKVSTPQTFAVPDIRAVFTALESRATSGKLVLVH